MRRPNRKEVIPSATLVGLLALAVFAVSSIPGPDQEPAAATPAVTVTETVTAKPKPRPTVTKTKVVYIERASRSYQRPSRSPSGPSAAQWAALRQCENGGSYRSQPGDQYRGAYQFDYGTWRGQGGSGDPAAASPAEQDARARSLYADRGAQPWPICGRHLR